MISLFTIYNIIICTLHNALHPNVYIYECLCIWASIWQSVTFII